MKTNIIIAGIGGVGGYFGGMLAKHFYGNDDIAINFVARGEHLAAMQQNGLKVRRGTTEFIAWPALATSNPSEIGIADFIIVTTKSYDLEAMIQQLQPCIGQDTIILPLLNGVDSRERIKKMLPGTLVLDGCAYIVSRLKQAGIVENSGNIQTLYFGLDHFENDRLRLLERLLKEATIEATLSNTISTILWEKFIFISPTATATSCFDKCIGEVVADTAILKTVHSLIEEVKQVAMAKGVIVSEDITEKSLNKLKSMPFEATSSMHSDFKNNTLNTELESLTGYVIHEAQKYHIDTPAYTAAYTELKKKGGQNIKE